MTKYLLLALPLLLLSPVLTAQVEPTDIYIIKSGDSTLSPQFVAALCKAARLETLDDEFPPGPLEEIIIRAAGTAYMDPDQPVKSLQWHKRFGKECYCEAKGKYPAGDILRQVVYSNYRKFADIVGPRKRLPLDLNLRDPNDNLTIYEYIDEKRMKLEAKHDNKRFEFQKDEEWRNIMFFFFIFSEYRVN